MRREFYMATKHTAIVLLFLLIWFSAFTEEAFFTEDSADAESNKQKNYFIKETEDGVELVQRLSWEALEDIAGFEVEIEQQDQKTESWLSFDKQSVQTNYIDVSLSPGKYRYRVWAINLLDQREDPSAYRTFTVNTAYQPELTNISPKVINFDEVQENTLTVTGKKLHKNTVFTLRNTFGTFTIRGTVLSLDESGSRAVISFDFNKIDIGTYVLSVVDPSDLFAESDTIVFRFQKPLDVYLSGGYYFTGFAGDTVFKPYFGKSFSAAGFGARLTVVPIKRKYGNFGFNLTGSGVFLRNQDTDYTLKGDMAFGQFNVAYYRPIIPHRLVFDVHAGFGIAALINTQFIYPSVKSPRFSYWGPTVNIGTALYVYLYKRLYLECNLDHIIPIRKGFPKYIVQPQLAIGWEF